jgi:hypothetical protein
LIARWWDTRIDPARGEDYDAFANANSRRMFASLPGCLGAFFLGTGEVRSVLSLWVDKASVDALDDSTLYADTVALFQSTGILRGPQVTRLFEVTGGTVSAPALAEELSAHRR